MGEAIQEFIGAILNGLAALVVAAIGFYGSRALKRLGAASEQSQVAKAAAEAVKWGAQTLADETGSNKFALVAARLSKRFPWVRPEVLENAIEAAVFNMNKALSDSE